MRPSPEINGHEVLLLGDGQNLTALFDADLMGLDPCDLLTPPSPLEAHEIGHTTPIGRCQCGYVGCCSVSVAIKLEGLQVRWRGIKTDCIVMFDGGQYTREIERALADYSWETPERTASRLITRAIDNDSLGTWGFTFSWASGRCRTGMMTVALLLEPGPYQVLLGLPWDGENIEDIVQRMTATLALHPETWPNVECNPQAEDLGPPPFRGAGWN